MMTLLALLLSTRERHLHRLQARHLVCQGMMTLLALPL
jgi:hypothetical protein